MCCSTQIRLSFALGIGTGGVSSKPVDCPAAAGRDDSKPGTSGTSESRRPSPDATLDPAPTWCTPFEAPGPVTETCVEHVRSLSKCEASDSGTDGCALLSLLPLRALRPLTHVAVDPTFELRAVRLERFVREALCDALCEALCHAEILFGRYRRKRSLAAGRQAMMMPTVISTLDQVASQVRSSASLGRMLAHVSSRIERFQVIVHPRSPADGWGMGGVCVLVGLWPLVRMTRH